MKDNLYTIFYAVTLGVVCALLLTGVGEFTEKYRKANKEAEEYRNILGVLGIAYEEKATAIELREVFNKEVQREKSGDSDIFKYIGEDGQVKAVAISFAGPGLWGPVKGFLAMDPDMETIRGLSFYEQEETPGLGGEIAAKWFTDQFIGKTMYDQSKKPGIRIIASGGQKQNEVAAITGATMTCDKVQAMINIAINQIAKEQQ